MNSALARQLATYASVGSIATAIHYALLVTLVEVAGWRAVPATLCGYIAGGVVAYILNRRHTFRSDRRHADATWRFALVAFLGFCLTFVLMSLFVERWGAPYLPAQVATTVVAMFMTFTLNRAWTFTETRG